MDKYGGGIMSKTINKKEVRNIKKEPVDRGYLSDWYINSVLPDDNPTWSEEHLDELFKDFHLIPKEN